MLTCSTCGALSSEETRYCKACGTPLATDSGLPRHGDAHVSGAEIDAIRWTEEPALSPRRLLGFLCVDVALIGSFFVVMAIGASMLVNYEQTDREVRTGSVPFCTGSVLDGTRECENVQVPIHGADQGRNGFPSLEKAISSPVFIYGVPALVFLYLWYGNARGGTVGVTLSGGKVLRKRSGHYLGYARGFIRTASYVLAPLSLLPTRLGVWHGGEWLHDRLARSVVKRSET